MAKRGGSQLRGKGSCFPPPAQGINSHSQGREKSRIAAGLTQVIVVHGGPTGHLPQRMSLGRASPAQEALAAPLPLQVGPGLVQILRTVNFPGCALGAGPGLPLQPPRTSPAPVSPRRSLLSWLIPTISGRFPPDLCCLNRNILHTTTEPSQILVSKFLQPAWISQNSASLLHRDSGRIPKRNDFPFSL